MIEVVSRGSDAALVAVDPDGFFAESVLPVRETFPPELRGPIRMSRSNSILFSNRLDTCG